MCVIDIATDADRHVAFANNASNALECDIAVSRSTTLIGMSAHDERALECDIELLTRRSVLAHVRRH